MYYNIFYCDPLAEVDWTLLAFLKNIIQNGPIAQDATTYLSGNIYNIFDQCKIEMTSTDRY